MLLRLPLDESSAKVRTGFPLDEAEDYDLEIWAGVIPFATVVEPARVDPDLRVAVAMPPYVERYRRPVAVAPGDLEALAPRPRSRPCPRPVGHPVGAGGLARHVRRRRTPAP